MRPKLLYFVTEDWYFCLHWMDFAIAARNAGYDVVVLTRVREHADIIKQQGLTLVPIELSRSNGNPFRCLLEWFTILYWYVKLKPDLIHHIAIKPVILGTLACYFSHRCKVINILPGLGYLFVGSHWRVRLMRGLVKPLLKAVFAYSKGVVVTQNQHDRDLLVELGLLNPVKGRIIGGVGVDLQKYTLQDEQQGKPIVLMAGRLLWDKGVGEFAAAAKLLSASGVNARFVLVGAPDPENPSAIATAQLYAWQEAGILEWWGKRSDMPEVYRHAHIVCLPSYREGMPTALLEAAACGRALVASDVPGCKDIVIDGLNGFLVPARDCALLSSTLQRLIEDDDLRNRMGRAGRLLVEEKYSKDAIHNQMFNLHHHLLEAPGRSI